MLTCRFKSCLVNVINDLFIYSNNYLTRIPGFKAFGVLVY